MDARETAAGVIAVRRESAQNDLLRFVTCGSVDDGKSTLIGRLLHDSHLLMEDQLAALSRDSARYGTAGKETDFAPARRIAGRARARHHDRRRLSLFHDEPAVVRVDR